MLLYIYITVLYGDVEEVKPPAPLASMSKCKLLKLTAVSVCEVGKKHYININLHASGTYHSSTET